MKPITIAHNLCTNYHKISSFLADFCESPYTKKKSDFSVAKVDNLTKSKCQVIEFFSRLWKSSFCNFLQFFGAT